MNPTPVQRVMLLLCAGFILFSFPGSALAQTAGVRADVERAAGKCTLCHSPLLRDWQNLPHGGAGLGPDGKPGKTKPLACTACHPSGVLRGSALKPQDSVKVCGKCHLKAAQRTGILLNSGDWASSGHAKSGVTCLTCHSLHRQGDAPLLQKRADALCLGCHAKDGKFEHKGEASDKARSNCTSCHDPHGSRQGGLYAAKVGGEAWQLKKKFTHKPVAEGKCSSCHDVHKSPTSGGSGGAVSGVVSEDDGGDEDLPVSGANRSLLSKPPATICYECHAEKKEIFLKSKHATIGNKVNPPQDNACAVCHLPHGSDYAHLTTYESSRLCLTCHPDKTPHHFLVSADVRQQQLACVECHNPHGSQYSSFLVRDRQQICAKCHKK